MDNAVDLAGYKHYLDVDGHRPDVRVAYLDIDLDVGGGAPVNGICLPVDPDRLAALDRRERNYDRVDVSDRATVFDGFRGAPGRLWTYVGRADSRARAAAARRDGTLVVAAGYLAGVVSAFAQLPGAQAAAFAASTDDVDVAVRELRRVDT